MFLKHCFVHLKSTTHQSFTLYSKFAIILIQCIIAPLSKILASIFFPKQFVNLANLTIPPKNQTNHYWKQRFVRKIPPYPCQSVMAFKFQFKHNFSKQKKNINEKLFLAFYMPHPMLAPLQIIRATLLSSKHLLWIKLLIFTQQK